MVLKVRVKVERIDSKYSVIYNAIVNSGFSGKRPEILIPSKLARNLKLSEVSDVKPTVKISGGGTIIPLIRYSEAVKIRLETKDRVEGPVVSDVLISETAKQVLLNDKLIQSLKIVIIDPVDGYWCFKDELGKKIRKGEE